MCPIPRGEIGRMGGLLIGSHVMRAIFEMCRCLCNIIMTRRHARCVSKHLLTPVLISESYPGADVGSDFYRALR